MQDITRQILFIVVVFITNTIQAITGFAGTLLAMPPSILLIGVNEAKVILNLIAWISCFVIAIQNYKFINKKELLKIVLFMLVGMIIGIKLFNLLELKVLLIGYGILIISISIKGLFIKKSFNVPKFFMGEIILLVSGIIHGMFISGGALLVVYAVSTFKNKNEFRANVSSIWVILNGIMACNHVKNGYITGKIVILLVISIIPMFIAIYLGNILYKKINPKVFLKITYILLCISGVLVII